MASNKLPSSLALCLLVILFLFFFSIVPQFKIGSWKLKKVDLLSDIRTPSADSLLASDATFPDSLQVKIDSVAKVAKSGCPPGIICIEDYSKDSTALRYFIKALQKTTRGGLMRVAMYGDSFIEGDVFCGGFRDTLQTLFGGKGVGYVPITSEVTGFRRNIKHKFENWETYSIVDKKDSLISVEFGPAGFCFVPLMDNWVEYKPTRQNGLREFNVVKFYYRNYGHANVDYTINDTITKSETLKTSEKLQEWKRNGEPIHSIKFQFTEFDSLHLYGASFESSKGIYVDNFSMRGNTGLGLSRIPDKMLTSFSRYRNYKLIILQYGLNVSLEDSMKYRWYANSMIKIITKIKEDYPKASVLMIGVSDRSSNITGEFKTMTSIPTMRNAQRYIAQKTGIAFWDLYEAMGGENSMVKFVEAKPSLAAKDYTHLTFKGGRILSGRLVKSLLHAKEKYEKKKR